MKFNTKTIHGGQEDIDPAYGSVMPPYIKLLPIHRQPLAAIKVLNIREAETPRALHLRNHSQV